MGIQKNAPKKVLVTLFSFIFHIKTEWNVVYKYLKTKIVSRDTNILPQMYWNQIFLDLQLQLSGGFWVSLIYPILNFMKMVCPKNVWMWHWWPNVNNCTCQCFSCCYNFWSNNLSGMVTDGHWILKLSNIPSLLQRYKKYLTESHPAHRICEHSWQFLGTKIVAAWEILASTVAYIKS